LTDAPENLTVERPFWCPNRDLEVSWYHRAQEYYRKGKRTQIKIGLNNTVIIIIAQDIACDFL